jgi:thioredoxin 2
MIRTCPNCGQKNRQRGAQMHLTMRCAACKTPFGAIAAPIEADAAEFDDVVTHATLPVLVDFWAEWCGPCHMAAPEVAKVAANMAGRALVLKVNSDHHAEIAARYGVRGIPNFVVLRHGQVVHQQAGVVSHAEMQRWLEQATAQG